MASKGSVKSNDKQMSALVAQLNDIEDRLSEDGRELQRVREQIVMAGSPVKQGEITKAEYEGATVDVKITQVQVAKHGRSGHAIVARGNVMYDGHVTTEQVELVYPIEIH